MPLFTHHATLYTHPLSPRTATQMICLKATAATRAAAVDANVRLGSLGLTPEQEAQVRARVCLVGRSI